jgi:DNA-directed RNA polymerase subunit M/transcription elongation factor TFIIS
MDEEEIYQRLVQMDSIYRQSAGLPEIEWKDISSEEYMKRIIESERSNIILKETGIECPKCHTKYVSEGISIQDRSGDEGASIYSVCRNQNCKWMWRTHRG